MLFLGLCRRGKGKGKEGTYGVDVEVACIENDGPVDVEVVHVLKRDVLDISVADVWSGPSLESCSVLSSFGVSLSFFDLGKAGGRDLPRRST